MVLRAKRGGPGLYLYKSVKSTLIDHLKKRVQYRTKTKDSKIAGFNPLKIKFHFVESKWLASTLWAYTWGVLHNFTKKVRVTRGFAHTSQLPWWCYIEKERTIWEQKGLIETPTLQGFFAKQMRKKAWKSLQLSNWKTPLNHRHLCPCPSGTSYSGKDSLV